MFNKFLKINKLKKYLKLSASTYVDANSLNKKIERVLASTIVDADTLMKVDFKRRPNKKAG
jgi:hypothetical protein